jgi:AcrR family transcriptional regulator
MARGLTDSDVTNFRERLCETAARLFLERGPSAFNMRELANRLGASAMPPYRYFKDKTEILAVVRARAFRRFADRLEAAHAMAGSQPEKSAAIGRAYVAFALEEQTSYRLMFDLSQSSDAVIPELEIEERRVHELMRSHVRMLVDMGVLEGDADLIGKNIMGFVAWRDRAAPSRQAHQRKFRPASARNHAGHCKCLPACQSHGANGNSRCP